MQKFKRMSFIVLSPECAICHNIKAANKVFENMSEFKFVSTKLSQEDGVKKEKILGAE